ncbi:MAG TPA: serine hydrolase domain-containing protein [Chryseolinea sp.]
MQSLKQNLQIFIFIVAICLGCSPKKEDRIDTHLGLERIPTEGLDRFLTDKMQELGIPGLAMAVINNGKIVYHRTMGYANQEKNQPVSDNTIFEGASLSKSVFAFFVMTYVEEGKLSLDRPLYEYLPYKDIQHDERYKKITARMVLSHRSGFPNWRRDESDGKLKLKFEPGTDYLYSGEGYQYLAMVLREIEGTDWKGLEAAFQNKVGKVLRLEHTVFLQTPYTRQYKAAPYNAEGKPVAGVEDKEFGAAYSIHTEPVDFSKWMVAVMETNVLKPESYSELLKTHSSVPSGAFDLYYCLGFMHPEFPIIKSDIYFHSGNNDGFTCWYALDPGKDWGFVLFTNSQFGEDLGEQLFFYLLLGPYTSIGGVVVVLLMLVAAGYFVKEIVRKIKSKKSIKATETVHDQSALR